MCTVVVDLSPFFLAKARENLRYWKQQRAAQLDLGGTDGTGGCGAAAQHCRWMADCSAHVAEGVLTPVLTWLAPAACLCPRHSTAGVAYMQAAMEALPLPDASLDAVVSLACRLQLGFGV
jgi:ubiquinone/menaquinone biosynthesis C-methylase UbiE